MAWAETIREITSELSALAGENASLGISAPGLANREGSAIAHMPGRLRGLEQLNWQKLLSRGRPVPVLNDAHAALLGEWHAGAASGRQDVMMLTLGTGVGGAAIVDGNLLRGHLGRAGHLGHVTVEADGPPDVTGAPGSIEWAIGNCTIVERTNGRFQTTHDLLEAHRSGDSFATQVWLRSIRHLACALNSLINVLDPELVIIGGGIARAGSLLFNPLRKYVASYEWLPSGSHVEIQPAALGEFAGAIGAAWHSAGLSGSVS
jgi:glucokinase